MQIIHLISIQTILLQTQVALIILLVRRLQIHFIASNNNIIHGQIITIKRKLVVLLGRRTCLLQVPLTWAI